MSHCISVKMNEVFQKQQYFKGYCFFQYLISQGLPQYKKKDLLDYYKNINEIKNIFDDELFLKRLCQSEKRQTIINNAKLPFKVKQNNSDPFQFNSIII